MMKKRIETIQTVWLGGIVLGILLGLFSPLYGEEVIKINDSTNIGIEALFRTYFLNDQRLQWSGMETTFGVESVLATAIEKRSKWGTLKVYSQFFINQSFDKNVLVDEDRQKYLQNFEIETFQVKQLYLQLIIGKLTLGLGKHPTIFGRNYTANFNNAFFDDPFSRNEAIAHFETGFYIKYHQGIFTLDAAVINGYEDMDTNSGKGFMGRLGAEGKNWSFGISGKTHDGIGSEWQKQYKNHAGIDFMIKLGKFRFSSEVIYDEYGFHRQFNTDDVFWGRSYYYRDIFYRDKTPISGGGGYLDLQYETPSFFLELNYGEYYPKKIGHIYHDDPIKRGLIKTRIKLADGLHTFGVILLENAREKEPLFQGASDYGLLFGVQYTL